MPITKSYVKEGTFRRGVVQALLQNNPCKSHQNIKKYVFKHETGNFVVLCFLANHEGLSSTGAWRTVGGFWCLLFISYIHIHATVCSTK